jgi:hypothetical protein
MPIFPVRTVKKLRYSTSLYIAGTSGVVASHVFSANGLFDPDITGTGHQPMGFDQMMLSYNHYAVTHCKLIVSFHNLIASTPVVSVKVDGAATPITVVDQILEFGGNVHSILEAKGVSGDVKVLENSVLIKAFEGVQDIADVTDLRGSVSANPAEQTYFHIQSWDNAGVTSSILCEVILEFTSLFLEPRDLSLSIARMVRALAAEELQEREEKKNFPSPISTSTDFQCIGLGNLSLD